MTADVVIDIWQALVHGGGGDRDMEVVVGAGELMRLTGGELMDVKVGRCRLTPG
jgi:hypothetical protein